MPAGSAEVVSAAQDTSSLPALWMKLALLRGPSVPRLTWGCTTHCPQERLHQLQVLNHIPRSLTRTFTVAWQVQADGSPRPSPCSGSENPFSHPHFLRLPFLLIWDAAMCPGCMLGPGSRKMSKTRFPSSEQLTVI